MICERDFEVFRECVQTIKAKLRKQATRERYGAKMRVRHSSAGIRERNFVIDEAHVEMCVVRYQDSIACEGKPLFNDLLEGGSVFDHRVRDSRKSAYEGGNSRFGVEKRLKLCDDLAATYAAGSYFDYSRGRSFRASGLNVEDYEVRFINVSAFVVEMGKLKLVRDVRDTQTPVVAYQFRKKHHGFGRFEAGKLQNALGDVHGWSAPAA